MNRRSFLSAAITQESSAKERNKYANKILPDFDPPAMSGIEPYTGQWTEKQVKHLLNRALFGYTKAQLEAAQSMSMNDLVDELLSQKPLPDPPVNSYYLDANDPDVLPGETWVNAPANQALNAFRNQSLKDWWLKLMIDQGFSIMEKMTLMLSNQVPIQFQAVGAPAYSYRYLNLLRSNCLGNYKQLIKAVSIDPAMLIYLNGYRNQKNKPDENYARELQELFTIGKGPGSAYTESDVIEAARVLTGFTLDLTTGNYKFIPQNHDVGNKQFSSFYNNTVITGKSGAAGEGELDELIDMLFAQDEVARHVVRFVYRWFVYYVIDEEIENTVITPLANQFRSGGYELKPLIETLLKSAHFYDDYNAGCVIKTPVDYTVAMMKHLDIDIPKSDLAQEFHAYRAINNFNFVLAMDLGDPPNVAGWEAFRLNPVFHEAWINSVTISYRNQLFEVLMNPNGYKFRTATLIFDYLNYTTGIESAEDPNALIANLSDRVLSESLSSEQVQELKSILLSNQNEDHYWTDAWLAYVTNPSDPMAKNTVLLRLQGFYRYFLSLAENQLI